MYASIKIYPKVIVTVIFLSRKLVSEFCKTRINSVVRNKCTLPSPSTGGGGYL